MSILNIYKPIGKTPLQAMDDFKAVNLEYKDHVMVYAGRLDPMTEGLLLVLTNEDRFKLDEYLGLTKTYEAEFLFGYRSDTFDVLGLSEFVNDDVDAKLARKIVSELKGCYELEFPVYSAYKVKGRPLHWWAREGRLSEIEIPKKDMEVLSVRDVSIEIREAAGTLSEIVQNIGLVTGDFRQGEIIKRWNKVLGGSGKLVVVKATLDVTSGTYVRSLAEMVGDNFGTGCLLLGLKRTRVGDFEFF